MAYNEHDILTDLHGRPIPQYYDAESDNFKPLTDQMKISNIDITLTALRDAIVKTGATSKTLADVVSQLTTMAGGKALSDIVASLSGVLNTRLTGRDIGEEFIFQNATETIGEGEHLPLNGQNKVIVSIPTGTSTSRTTTFKATSLGVSTYMLGSKIESTGVITLAVSTTGQNEVWEIDGLAGYDDFYCEVTSIAGGNVTVKGRLVA